MPLLAPLLRGKRGFAVILVLAVVSLLLFIRSSNSNDYVVVDDDYAPYRKPSTSYDTSPLSHYHDNDLFDTGSNWVPDTWKPAAWLPDLPFLSGGQHHLPDGKRGRVLVTGGAGALGIPVVDRLLKEGFAVTLHDLRDPSPRDVHYIRQRNPDATKGGRLAFIKGDILSRTHLSTLMKELTAPAMKKGKKMPPAVEGSLGAGGGLVGVVNLAGISRDIWCSSRVEECEELNVQSTTHLFDTLAETTHKKLGQKPWFLHLSSLDVYDPSTKQTATSNTDELTSLGQTKLLAERELEKSYNKYMNDLVDGPNGMTSDDDDGIRTMILRPSTIYGSPADIQDRLVPALIQNALADLPVQILYGNAQVDFLHIDDALDGFIGAIERLMGRPEPADEVEDVKSPEVEVADGVPSSESSGFELTEDPVEPVKRDVPAAMQVGPLFEAYDLVSGYSSTPKQLLDMVMGLTQSRSPVQDHTSNLDPNIQIKLPLMSLEVPSTLRSKLGFQAAISLDQGIAGYVSTMRQEFTDWAREYLGAECPSSPLYGDPKVTHVADLRNKHLQRLVGCTANIGVNHEGWIHHMKCGDSTCAPDNIKVPSFNWNQSIFTIIPYENADAIAEAQRVDEANAAANAKWGWAFGLLGTESRKEGAQNQPVRIQLEEKNTGKVVGFIRKDVPEGKTRYVKLRLFDHVEARDSETIVSVFEPKVANNASYLQFTIPGTNEYLGVEAHIDINRFSINRRTESSPYDFRLTLLCCPTDKPWPLLLDDYETADIRYGTTGDIPFDTSKRSQECKRVERALDRMESLISPVPTEGERGNFQHPLTLATTKHPHDWVLRDLPTCMNHCDNPLICVQDGHCRCIQADDCITERANPLTPLELPAGRKLVSIATNEDFVKAVGNLRWQDVVLPSAMRVLKNFPDLIKVHVVTGYDHEEENEAAECHKLQSSHCFSADNIMYRAMRTISVPVDEADLIILPVYQACDSVHFALHEMVPYAIRTIPDFDNRASTVILTHDWGMCINFAWDIWEARTNHKLHPEALLQNVFVWSVMGDTVSRCYRPHMDTVIPARTCNSIKLKETFGNLDSIVPASKRPHLLTWSGTMWGTGKSARMRLVCERGGVASEELVPGGGHQSSFLSWDYMKELSEARFCPQPAGIAGWSFRVQDAIYAGCIPVFMSDGTHYPFADILDYSKFSVRVSPTEFDHLEHILRAIPLEKVESMQAHLVSTREAFLYSTDEHPEEELERKGPLWYSMQSARIRLSTEYPTSKVPATEE